MGRTAMVLALLVAAAACGGEAETTTSGSQPAGTTTQATTTTSVPPTTTTVPEVTTTTVPATTTTVPPATTTSLAGSVTSLPVVAAGDGVVGWWDGSEWIEATGGPPVPASGGEEYQLLLLSEPVALAIGGEPGPGCEFVEGSADVPIDFGELDGSDWPRPRPVAVSASWNVQPYPVTVLDPVPEVYVGAASELLASRGIDDRAPTIVQAIRTDLEGDGVEEAFVVAERQANGSLNPAAVGDYSVAFMRKVVDEVVETAVLELFVVEEPEVEGAIIALDVFRFDAFGDLNGDGIMEFAVDDQYYEGSSTTIWQYVDDDLGPVPVMAVGCGV
ncbi:MAG TPA: hypothetical protein VGC47_10865 [Acidimicrobiia bacterium]